MYNSKLFALLSTFETDEWKAFHRYLLAQVRHDAEIVQLYEYIQKYRKKLDHKKLKQPYVKDELFNGKTDKNFQNLLSKIYSHVLDYISMRQILNNPFEKAIHLSRSLNDRKLYKQAYQIFINTLNTLDDVPTGIDNSLYLFRLSKQFHFSENRFHQEYRTLYLSHALDQWNKSKKTQNLSLAILLLINQRFFHEEQTIIINQLKEEASSLSANDQTSPILTSLIRCLEDDDKDCFDYLYQRFVINRDTLITDQLGVLIFRILVQYQNHTIRYNRGNVEQLNLTIQQALTTGYLLYEGQITDKKFKLVIHSYAIQGLYDEGRKIMNGWCKYLKKDNKESVLSICEATILTYEHRYEEASDILINHSFNDIASKRTVRILELLLMFGMYDNKDFITSQIQNFLRFYRRHKTEFSKAHLTGIERLGKTLLSIVRDESSESIIEFIKEEKPLIRRQWLIQYLEKQKAKA